MTDLPNTRPLTGALAAPCRSIPPVAYTEARTGFFGLWRQSKHLGELDARMLKDIGVTPEQVTRELSRPLWDLPSGWRL